MEVGPKSIFTLPNGQLFNTNPHAQAYENAFGILYDDPNVASGHPGGVVGEYETRVAHETNGLYLDLDRQTFDAQWEITDNLNFHAIVGRASRIAGSWSTSTPTRACSSRIGRTTTRSSRISRDPVRRLARRPRPVQLGRRLLRERALGEIARAHVLGQPVRVRSDRGGRAARRHDRGPGRVLQQPHARAEPPEPIRRRRR